MLSYKQMPHSSYMFYFKPHTHARPIATAFASKVRCLQQPQLQQASSGCLE